MLGLPAGFSFDLEEHNDCRVSRKIKSSFAAAGSQSLLRRF